LEIFSYFRRKKYN